MVQCALGFSSLARLEGEQRLARGELNQVWRTGIDWGWQGIAFRQGRPAVGAVGQYGSALPVVLHGGVDDYRLERSVQTVVLNGKRQSFVLLQTDWYRHAVTRTGTETHHFRLSPCGAIVQRTHHGNVLLLVGHLIFIGKEQLDLARGQLHHHRFPTPLFKVRSGNEKRFLSTPGLSLVCRIAQHYLVRQARVAMRTRIPGIHQPSVRQFRQLGIGVAILSAGIRSHQHRRAPPFRIPFTDIYAGAFAVHTGQRTVREFLQARIHTTAYKRLLAIVPPDANLVIIGLCRCRLHTKAHGSHAQHSRQPA